MKFGIGEIVKLKSDTSIIRELRGVHVRIKKIELNSYNMNASIIGIEFLRKNGNFEIGRIYNCNFGNLEKICGTREEIE